MHPGMKYVSALLAALCIFHVAGSDAFGQTCFPECREGYVCNPQGECVSACNPPCESDQRCIEGECYVRADQANAAQSTAPNAQEETNTSQMSESRMALLQIGAIYQFLDTEILEVVSDGGFEIAGAFFPLDIPVFLRPRVAIILGACDDCDNFYDISVDFGYEYRVEGKRADFSVRGALTLGFWPGFVGLNDGYNDEPVSPYVGVAVDPTLELGPYAVIFRIERGYQLATDPNVRALTMGLFGGYSF
jgi:hypothetical protein